MPQQTTVGQTKQFGKGQRTVPLSGQKAQKWYPVDDEPQPKQVSILYPCGYCALGMEMGNGRGVHFVLWDNATAAPERRKLGFSCWKIYAGAGGNIEPMMESAFPGEICYFLCHGNIC